MMAKEKWTALNGISGNKVYLRLSDVVLFEEMDVNGQPATLLVTNHGVKVTVTHTADHVASLLDKGAEELMEMNLKFWQEREAKRRELKELAAKADAEKAQKE
jgi:hypothetical protein